MTIVTIAKILANKCNCSPDCPITRQYCPIRELECGEVTQEAWITVLQYNNRLLAEMDQLVEEGVLTCTD